MRKLISILIVLGIAGGFARAYNARNVDYQSPSQSAAEEDAETKMVDLAADIVYPYDLGNDSSVICLVGNFIGHHNGAVITCDSAVRYGDQRLECFGNVLINKNETYIYGDRADYDGVTNRAEVYSPLVKVVDGEATLYTYKFRFDTKSNIGEFGDGGVITNRDNIMESDRGYYYADLKEVIGVERVEMRNETYQMTGDSVIYNIETDNARFFTSTNIWNDKGEYLYADRGDYDSYDDRYIITSNGYILTDTREVWSDSLDYNRETGYVLLRNDIQIDDTEHKVLSFGDWGEYWDNEGNALLTRNPSVISYDPEQGDSLFMRADTIWMYTRSTIRDREEAEAAARAAEELAEAEQERAAAEKNSESGEESQSDEGGNGKSRDAHRRAVGRGALNADGGEELAAAELTGAASDEEEQPTAGDVEDAETADSSDEASENTSDDAEGDSDAAEDAETDENAEEAAEREIPLSELSKDERRERLREIAEQERAEKKRLAEERKKEKDKALKAKLEEIAERRQAKRNIQLDKQARRDSVAAAGAKARDEQRKRKMIERLNRKGIKLQPADSATLASVDSIAFADMYFYDSLVHARMDSILLSWLPDTSDEGDYADTVEVDTVYRLVLGYRNVRIYRSDFQAVCDSLSSSTRDSVIRMYIEPVLWNQANQITSEQTDIHTKNEQLDFAEFIGKPMMISKLDTLHYNQVAGKTMYSYFRDNEIYRDDVDGNAETIYYMQDDETHEVQGLMYITSADMSFFIEQQEIVGITYRGNPDYVLYPMDKIPDEQPLFLQGFTWQENRRPTQDSVFTRVVRPSLRAEKEALARPSFPIAARIESFKTRLMEQGRWYDRDETLSGDVIYWLDMNTDWREHNERDAKMRERQRSDRRRAPKPVADTVAAALPVESDPKPVTEAEPVVDTLISE